jgi:hypothetical protein
MTEMKTIGSMTTRQRTALAELLRAAARASEVGEAVEMRELAPPRQAHALVAG